MGNPQTRRLALRGILFGAAALVLPRPRLLAGDNEVMEKLTTLKTATGSLHTRLDRIETSLTSLEQRVERCVKNQGDIDALISEIAGRDKEMKAFMTTLVASGGELNGKLEACSGQLQEVECVLKHVNALLQETICNLEQVNCTLGQVNCILCKLPGNIRRAKIRAFIFGFLVGMGVSAAIGGGGGAVGAVSAGVW